MKLYYVVSLKRKTNVVTDIGIYYIFIPDFLNFIDEQWKHSGLMFNKNTFKLNSINYNIKEEFEIIEITKENIEEYHKSNLKYMRHVINSMCYKFMLSKTEIIISYMKKELKDYLDYLLEDDNGNL